MIRANPYLAKGYDTKEEALRAWSPWCNISWRLLDSDKGLPPLSSPLHPPITGLSLSQRSAAAKTSIEGSEIHGPPTLSCGSSSQRSVAPETFTPDTDGPPASSSGDSATPPCIFSSQETDGALGSTAESVISIISRSTSPVTVPSEAPVSSSSNCNKRRREDRNERPFRPLDAPSTPPMRTTLPPSAQLANCWTPPEPSEVQVTASKRARTNTCGSSNASGDLIATPPAPDVVFSPRTAGRICGLDPSEADYNPIPYHGPNCRADSDMHGYHYVLYGSSEVFYSPTEAMMYLARIFTDPDTNGVRIGTYM